MYDITDFGAASVARCGAALRAMGANATSMEEVAQRVVVHLYEQLLCRDRKRATALVRFYKTHAYGRLPHDLQRFAAASIGEGPKAHTPCLTLLATTGDDPAWCCRHSSAEHRAIPLTSELTLARVPMIHGLLERFGLDARAIIAADSALLVGAAERMFDVLHVPDAIGSPLVPAQGFVRAHRIQSVLGVGGMLRSGDLFAVIMFAKVAIPRETAERWKALALGVKLAIEPFVGVCEIATHRAAA